MSDSPITQLERMMNRRFGAPVIEGTEPDGWLTDVHGADCLRRSVEDHEVNMERACRADARSGDRKAGQ